MVTLPPLARTIGRSGRFDVTRLHRSGTDAQRILLIADRVTIGSPESDPWNYFPEHVADRVRAVVDRGLDLDVLTDVGPALRAVRGAFASWRLWRYDAVVVVLDTRTAIDRTLVRRQLRRLLDDVLGDAALATQVLVVALDRTGGSTGLRGRHGDPIGSHDLLELPVTEGDRVEFVAVPTSAEGAATASPTDMRVWADAIAGTIAARDAGHEPGDPVRPDARELRDLPQDEAERQRALDETGVLDTAADPRLDRIVELARDAFGTTNAELNFLDRNRLHKMSVAGAARVDSQRSGSFCNLAIQQAAPTVMPDARHDPRVADSMADPLHTVGFYAAYPIESIDGYRIGALCIYDPEPRDTSAMDLGLLRDLALLAEAEIIDADRIADGERGPYSDLDPSHAPRHRRR